ncbi:multiple inositol polyphosphate phosphatase 1-like [Glandiceps talaboti]
MMAHWYIYFAVFISSIPYLYTQSPNLQTVNFSTKTKYADSFGGYDELKDNFGKTMQLIKSRNLQCKPVQVNTLFRHATRYPSKKDFGNLKRLPELQEHMKEQHSILKIWRSQFQNVEPKSLADVGRKEMFLLGQRFSQYFPELITANNFVAKKFVFKSSNLSRTIESAKIFIDGLQSMVGKDEDKKKMTFDLNTLNVQSDVLLRFFDICEKFTVSVEDNDTALYEVKKFGSGAELQAVVDRLTKKLNISVDFKLNSDHAKTIHTICSFEFGLLGRSDWCDILTEDDLQVMEYWADLKHYWRKSYGYQINYHISCSLLKDIFTAMDKAVVGSEQENYPVGVFWFGHAETLFPIFAILGLFKDPIKLRADNFHEHRNRLFRGGKLSPFAGNIAFVVYKCDQTVNNDEQFMVEVLVNEKPVKLPCCESTFCPYSTVKACYNKWLTNCDFETICELQTTIHENEIHDEL